MVLHFLAVLITFSCFFFFLLFRKEHLRRGYEKMMHYYPCFLEDSALPNWEVIEYASVFTASLIYIWISELWWTLTALSPFYLFFILTLEWISLPNVCLMKSQVCSEKYAVISILFYYFKAFVKIYWVV